MQCYENMEIIVCDNFSQDNTKRVVESFCDGRVRYINTGRRISMSRNWEFALSHATGDFVTYIGDDDGFLPGAISSIVKIIEDKDVEAMSWRWASYYWPDCINKQSKNLLFVPIGGSLEVRKTSDVLRRVMGFEVGYEVLPFLYKGIVSKRLLDEIKNRSGGIFFHSMNPDLYSAIAVSSVVEKYAYSTIPYSLNGTSFNSNGASQFNANMSSVEANRFNSEGNIPFHADLVLAPSHPIAVAESYLQARRFLPELSAYEFDYKEMIKACYKEIRHASQWRFDAVKKAVMQIAQKNDLLPYATDMFMDSKNNHSIEAKVIGLQSGVSIFHKHLIIDCSSLEISDVYSASILTSSVLYRGGLGLSISWLGVLRSTVRLVMAGARRKIGLQVK